MSLRRKEVPPRVVDAKVEARHAKERQLRNEGNALIAQGRVDDAYAKFQELARVAPNSPANNQVLRKLDAIRQQTQATRAQLDQAKDKFNEGVTLLNKNDYAGAAKSFEESFHLNPNSEETVTYLKIAQQGEDLTRREKLQKQQFRSQEAVTQTNGQRPPLTGTASTRGVTSTAPTALGAATAHLTTVVNANVTDGYIMVKAGSQMLAYEQLWQETGHFFTKRKVAN